VLRYTITLVESGGLAATNVSVTDDIPANTSGFSVVSVPPGSTDTSTGAGTGSNLTGYLDIGNVFVPANGSVTIVFDVTVGGTANPGDVISNQANIANPNGLGASPLAPDVVVSQTAVPTSGTKTLYLFDESTSDPNGFNSGPRPYLSRTPPVGAQSAVAIPKTLPSQSWTMTPALQAPLTIDAGSIPVTLYLGKSGSNSTPVQRTLTVRLSTVGAVTAPLGNAVTQTFAAPLPSAAIEVTFNIPLASVTTLPAGTQIVLTATNVTPGGGQRTVLVLPTFGGEHSRVDFAALTVISVDAAVSYDAPYPAGATQSSFAPGATVSLRADVSDPFGVFDVANVSIDILDDANNAVVANQPMAFIAGLGGAAARYEYVYALPVNGSGTWTYRVTAVEGTEGVVTHERSATFSLSRPLLTITKSVTVESDPANGSINPKAIPGAFMVYTVTVANAGTAAVDSDSVNVRDVLPSEAALYVDNSSGDPIVFADGVPPSGLTFDYATAVSYSSQPGGGAPFDYLPIPDAAGFDPAVTGIRITPQGALAGSTGSGTPEFTLRYRTRID
jgi:uncharacterized repeat protein (TIGR01451 family)